MSKQVVGAYHEYPHTTTEMGMKLRLCKACGSMVSTLDINFTLVRILGLGTICNNGIILYYKQGGSFRSPPAAPDLINFIFPIV